MSKKKGIAKPPKEGLVIDSSVAIAWCFPDERDTFSQSVLNALVSRRAIVPDLWQRSRLSLAGVFARLGIGAETWQMRLKKLRAGRLFGRFFAATRDRLKAAAEHLGVGIVRNLSGCPVA